MSHIDVNGFTLELKGSSAASHTERRSQTMRVGTKRSCLTTRDGNMLDMCAAASTAGLNSSWGLFSSRTDICLDVIILQNESSGPFQQSGR